MIGEIAALGGEQRIATARATTDCEVVNFAHLGVIQALRELDIPVDMVAASSLVGANQVKNRQLDEQIADLYLALDVDLALLDFSPENVRRGARIGYEASFAQLKAWWDEPAGPAHD